jgi:hypothetical protein
MIKLLEKEKHYILMKIPDSVLEFVKFKNGKIGAVRYTFVKTTPEILKEIENGSDKYRTHYMFWDKVSSAQ